MAISAFMYSQKLNDNLTLQCDSNNKLEMMGHDPT